MNLSPRLQALRAASGRLPVSVIITTLNEEVNIRECLESVAWADEILLVDSFSSAKPESSNQSGIPISGCVGATRRRRPDTRQTSCKPRPAMKW